MWNVNPQHQNEVIVKRLKDGAYLTIPEKDLESTMKQGFILIERVKDEKEDLEKLFGLK